MSVRKHNLKAMWTTIPTYWQSERARKRGSHPFAPPLEQRWFHPFEGRVVEETSAPGESSGNALRDITFQLDRGAPVELDVQLEELELGGAIAPVAGRGFARFGPRVAENS